MEKYSLCLCRIEMQKRDLGHKSATSYVGSTFTLGIEWQCKAI